jgi:hypothetical protein
LASAFHSWNPPTCSPPRLNGTTPVFFTAARFCSNSSSVAGGFVTPAALTSCLL